MAERDLEVDLYEFLQKIQLEQFFEKIDKVLHLTRLSHFDHVTETDLYDINMSKPEQRRLLDAVKKHKKDRKKASKTRFSLRKSKKKENSNQSSSVKHAQGKSCLINESSLKLLGELGDGAFGVVCRGEWTPTKGSKVPVAVKCLKFSDKDAFLKEQDNFMREASAMSDLDHPNVIRLCGIVLATPIKLVMELAVLGSLLDKLRTEPEKFLVSTLYDFVLQIASGMSYLESKRYVHRDLASRNILLSSYDKVKIGDFGLMRPLSSQEDIYVMNPAGKVAVAWCAPECLKNREFSHASDAWAFGITVIEMFSYGKQPWNGLSGSQILDIIDEPANGRPGKPDHCPDKLYSLLIEHCWDPNPKDRSKFSSISEKLQDAIPEDVTLFFDLDNETNPSNLMAKSGDIVTVITWKSRLGTEFGKGQNKRTAEVGYFPTALVTRGISKNRGSSRPRVAKVKDISPPLGNSFTHCAHRGNGETPNWGTIMSDGRLVPGKRYPLNLPTKFICLNNSDPESQIEADAGEIDTCSLMSQDSSNYSSSLSLGPRSCADSGYYSNRDTLMSQDYEQMVGSNPIAIPGWSSRYIMSPGINTPGTFFPSQQHSRRLSGTSSQLDPHGQRCGLEEYSNGSEIRPALPVKQGMFTHNGNIKRKVSVGFHMESPYENINEVPGANYENMQGQSSVSSQDPEGPLLSSSPESAYMNQQDLTRPDSVNFININYPIIYDRPTKDGRFDLQKSGRCYSLPEVDLKNRLKNKERKRNSLSLEKEIMMSLLNQSKSAPTLDQGVGTTPEPRNWENRSAEEVMSEEIYENIEIYNVPQAIISDIPPPLPVKRRSSEKRISAHRFSGSLDVDISKKLSSSHEVFEELYSHPTSQDTPNFDSHLYAEISDQIIEKINFDEGNSLNDEDPSLEESNRKDSFVNISKDYADLDAICAKLRENTTPENEPSPVVDATNKITKDEDVLWKRFSTDEQRTEQRQRTRRSKRGSVSSDNSVKSPCERHQPSETRSSSSNSLKHPCSELESVPYTCATLVTTV